MQHRSSCAVTALNCLFFAGVCSADTFVLDAASPSLTATEDMRNDAPGPFPGAATVGLDRSTLGLLIGDVIDAISLGDDPVTVPIHGPHNHLFSVTRNSIGLGGSGVAGERAADTAPGASPGHAADQFLWDHAVPGTNVLSPPGQGWRAGSRSGDEANTMLTNGGGRDNVAGLEKTTMAYFTLPVTPPTFEIYFSLAPGSPTLGAIGASPADILAVGGAFGGIPVVFRSAASLGVPAGATVDMDAMSLEVQPAPAGPPTLVSVQFSVTSLTATGWPFGGTPVTSGAEILVFDGGSFIGHTPADFGLDVDDDIDALESILPPPAPTCPSDLNGDGITNVLDLLIMLTEWGACGG